MLKCAQVAIDLYEKNQRQKEQERIAEQVRDSQSQDFTFENDDQSGSDD